MTGTYYPDPRDIRFEIALDTAKGWSEQELPLVVVDGSPDDKVAGVLRARGHCAEMLDDHSIVVIGRTERSKESMPPFQRRTQKNWLAGCLSVC